MIDKILDKYYARKLEEKIKDFLMHYLIDKKFEYGKLFINLYVKDTEPNTNNYIFIIAIPYEQCFDILIDKDKYRNLKTTIEERLNQFYS